MISEHNRELRKDSKESMDHYFQVVSQELNGLGVSTVLSCLNDKGWVKAKPMLNSGTFFKRKSGELYENRYFERISAIAQRAGVDAAEAFKNCYGILDEDIDPDAEKQGQFQ